MRTRIFIGILSLLMLLDARVLLAQASAAAPGPAQPLTVRCVVGLPDIKQNANGLLMIQDAVLHFDAGKHRAAVPIASIDDIFVGSEMTEAGGIYGEAAKGAALAAPYDSGAALTLLLRQKVDVMTVTYRDENRGLHAAIFALPKDRAQQFRTDLLAQKAAAIAGRAGASSGMAAAPQAASAEHAAAVIASAPGDASKPAIRIEPVVATDASIPQEFRMAIYEELVERLRRSGLYSQVYRSGDRAASGNPNVETLVAEVQQFKKGSQTERELTVVLGASKVVMHVTLTRRNGEAVVSQAVVGRVRFFGENLGVTRDAAKQIVKILQKNLQTPAKSAA
jgi:hypothetical protein